MLLYMRVCIYLASSCSRVLITQIGLVAVMAINPEEDRLDRERNNILKR